MTVDLATHVACLTPAGTGAIAVLAIRGPDAWPVLRELFRPASHQELPEQPRESGAIWFGRIGDGRIADEVVLTVKQIAPTICLELHTHGGRQVADWVIELLLEKGLTQCSWERFLHLTDSIGDADAWQQLARAPTVRTATILLDQAQGALRSKLTAVVDSCRGGRTAEATERVDEILQYSRLGMHLISPWIVVVAGPPNVGKSSLVNALAGFERSIIAPVAGTTRDVVSTVTAIDGWPVELRDTAGLRVEATGLEAAGIERAQAAVDGADLVLWLSDAIGPTAVAAAAPNRRVVSECLTVLNKCDLVGTTPAMSADIRISARTGAGLFELCAAISRKLVPSPPARRSGVPYLSSQIAALLHIRSALTSNGATTVGEALAALGA